MPPMDEDDYQLSGKISRRGMNDPESDVLRKLLVRRLTISFKAVVRRPLKPRDDTMGLYCEQCSQWFRIDGFPTITQCPGCDSLFRMETAIYEHIEPDQLQRE
jgi:hypothetical protein